MLGRFAQTVYAPITLVHLKRYDRALLLLCDRTVYPCLVIVRAGSRGSSVRTKRFPIDDDAKRTCWKIFEKKKNVMDEKKRTTLKTLRSNVPLFSLIASCSLSNHASCSIATRSHNRHNNIISLSP